MQDMKHFREGMMIIENCMSDLNRAHNCLMRERDQFIWKGQENTYSHARPRYDDDELSNQQLDQKHRLSKLMKDIQQAKNKVSYVERGCKDYFCDYDPDMPQGNYED